MSNKPNILQKSNELQRNIIITILILLIFIFGGIIIYFSFYREEPKVINRMPYIELKGDNIVILNENDPYIEYGYDAYDLEDGDLTPKVSVQNKVDTSNPGIYTLTYVANDSQKQAVAKTRNVIVKSNEFSSNFSLKGNKVILLKKGNNFTEPGFTATSENEVLNDIVKVYGEVDGQKEGIYTLYYVCEDNKELAVLTRKVIVSDKFNNVDLAEEDLKYISNYNIKELKNNYKIIPEHFSSKTMLILTFSLCNNNGNANDTEISSCLEKYFKLNNREISHLTNYDLIKGNISYDETSLTWKIAPNLLLNQLEENLKKLKDSIRLSIENQDKLLVYVEENEYIYKYTFVKQDENYLFVSVDTI